MFTPFVSEFVYGAYSVVIVVVMIVVSSAGYSFEGQVFVLFKLLLGADHEDIYYVPLRCI